MREKLSKCYLETKGVGLFGLVFELCESSKERTILPAIWLQNSDFKLLKRLNVKADGRLGNLYFPMQ